MEDTEGTMQLQATTPYLHRQRHSAPRHSTTATPGTLRPYTLPQRQSAAALPHIHPAAAHLHPARHQVRTEAAEYATD